MTTVLHVVDGHAIGHRAYHAAGARGWLAAVGTFGQMLDRIERDHRPARAVIAFDVAGPTWRHDLYPSYKAHRPTPEPGLCKAMPRWQPMAAALGWRTVAVRGYEADDAIATIVTRARATGWRCVVHASDKDLMALVGADVLQVTATGAELGPAEVEAKLGVPPARVADYLAIAGDAGDGVPGIPGAGAKTATDYCRRFPDLDTLIAANPKVRGKYPLSTVEGIDALRLSRRLVELARTVPIDLVLGEMSLRRRDEDAVRALVAEPPPAEQLTLGQPGPHFRGHRGLHRQEPAAPALAPIYGMDKTLALGAAIRAAYDALSPEPSL